MKILEVGKDTKENWSLETKCSGIGNGNKGCDSTITYLDRSIWPNDITNITAWNNHW